ncbi:hypothetical protein KIN20_027445 [Parelaphostrongylus tenuis]|uniref:Uncharacterized protein n=1 Tax=Parelaphostrongylus tenuis TaxID=148309 RepID=A0AAD5QZA9_PARTN|nr:hypothetical protein KIN20_027445 [Parelaphostrongylus tenuis]
MTFLRLEGDSIVTSREEIGNISAAEEGKHWLPMTSAATARHWISLGVITGRQMEAVRGMPTTSQLYESNMESTTTIVVAHSCPLVSRLLKN